ncbi:MAG: Fe-S cluster assembly protein SufD [Propionibacteriaceae bacterium]|nr:Fe-S cluster assembly protein SufD [Propionibacteriaceae bacterium]
MNTPDSQQTFPVTDGGVPDSREEQWRFTPLDKLTGFFDESLKRSTLEVHSQTPIDTLGLGEGIRGSLFTPVDVNTAICGGMERAHYVKLESVSDSPLRLSLTGQSTDPSANHLVIEALQGSRTTVVATHQGLAHHSALTEILVGDGAELTVVSIYDWEAGSIHLGHHVAQVGHDATYRHIVVTLGGELNRIGTTTSYSSSGGHVELLGVYFAHGGQHHEHRLLVDHNQPACTSMVDYRGALQGQGATSIWVGDVKIRPQGEGIETYETNKNLVLSDGCRAESIPNLEIETGDIVGAGHSASTGRFDPEHLFYLRSRGISEDEAKTMIVRGFFTSVLARIGVGDVEEALLRRIDEELAKEKHE